ncbi:unnamed protein product [Bursaphelenchus okinawaensis]|uniref:alcohol dehydrogenase n=1 Tax=Bursaphelenchus okinawaensis TaxID=465554 RepID=A0A811KB90_9BILA|nr:unnamed protein product [Bursaphelenchus okinawaensis]CAG9097455.1 unnamed protein product [Bursaphelenchus okinawaensis]
MLSSIINTLTMSETIPKTQKAACYDKVLAPITIREIPVPEPGADDVLVKVLYTGVCHSDLSIWKGTFDGPQKFPCVGGHEGAGVVVKLGSNATHLKLGDKVGIKWINATCMNCEMCRRGYEPNCPDAINSGFSRHGSFQQYAIIRETEAIKIPDGLGLAEAAPILCAGLTVYKALLVSGAIAGDTVAITGAGGGLGSLCIQYAKAMGFQVLAIESKEKESFCRSLGADYFICPFTSTDIVADIQKLTNGGPHAVLNVTNAVPAIQKSTDYVRTRGTVVLVSLPPGELNLNIISTVFRTIDIRSTYVGNRVDTVRALDFVAKGHVKVPIEIRPFDKLNDTFEELKSGTLKGRVVLDLWK